MSKRPVPEYDYLLPPEECEKVYKILGKKPDIDPCGHPDQFMEAQQILYGSGPGDDGMAAPWVDEHGQPAKVWLNPNHGQRTPAIMPNFEWYPLNRWIAKATVEAQRGATIMAVFPATTDREWFHDHVGASAQAFCLLAKRIKNFLPDRESINKGDPVRLKQPNGGHMYAIWTQDQETLDRFYEVLGKRNAEGIYCGLVCEVNPIGGE